MKGIAKMDEQEKKITAPEWLSIKEASEYLNIGEREFWEVIDFYRSLSPHLWEKINGEWKIVADHTS